jgi:hypothetical protein
MLLSERCGQFMDSPQFGFSRRLRWAIRGVFIFGTVVHAPPAHPSRMKMFARDFWTQTTQTTRSTQINIRVFCVPYGVTKDFGYFRKRILKYFIVG